MVLKQTSWNSVGGLRIFSLWSKTFLSIYLSNWLETGLQGNRYPIAADVLRITPSKLEFFCWSKPVKHHDWKHSTACAEQRQNWSSPATANPQASRLRVTPSKLEFSSGRLPKTLLVSYVSLAFQTTCLISIDFSDWLLSSPRKTQTEEEPTAGMAPT